MKRNEEIYEKKKEYNNTSICMHASDIMIDSILVMSI